MPDSEAVYQPTTVGYSYEHGGDVNDVNGAARIRSGFSRIIYRHKVSTRKWFEWVLLSVGLCATIAGFATILVNLLRSGGSMPVVAPGSQDDQDKLTGDKTDDNSRGSFVAGFSITLLGILMGVLWIWLRFFRPDGKSQRGGMSRASGQMLGGLNPSTDLLVGSTSQYGPVLTEAPSQMTANKQIINDNHVVPMSDLEEETHTLMQDVGALTTTTPITNGQKTTPVNQIPA